jgi:hypothetical protein
MKQKRSGGNISFQPPPAVAVWRFFLVEIDFEEFHK